jgi:hypothetical protein
MTIRKTLSAVSNDFVMTLILDTREEILFFKKLRVKIQDVKEKCVW